MESNNLAYLQQGNENSQFTIGSHRVKTQIKKYPNKSLFFNLKSARNICTTFDQFDAKYYDQIQKFEVSSHDRIKMTEFWLDFDQKIFTPMNLNVETWLKFTTPHTLTLPQKNMLVRSAWTGAQPWFASSHWLGHLPSLASPVTSLLYKKKHQTRRLGGPRTMVKVCCFHKACQFQFRSCSIVKVRRCDGLVIFILSSWIGQVNIPQN